MAGPAARPVSRSQTTVVSRWFVIPIAAISAGARSVSAIASRTTPSTESQISSGSCSTRPGAGKYWGNSR